MTAVTKSRFRPALYALALLCAVPLSGCPEPRLGPDLKMGMMALAQCRHDQALLLADAALARGDAQTRLRALLLKAATRIDRGDQPALEALYPEIDTAWQAARRRVPTPAQRAEAIDLFLGAARTDRQARGIAPDCKTLAPVPPATTAPPVTTPTPN